MATRLRRVTALRRPTQGDPRQVPDDLTGEEVGSRKPDEPGRCSNDLILLGNTCPERTGVPVLPGILGLSKVQKSKRERHSVGAGYNDASGDHGDHGWAGVACHVGTGCWRIWPVRRGCPRRSPVRWPGCGSAVRGTTRAGARRCGGDDRRGGRASRIWRCCGISPAVRRGGLDGDRVAGVGCVDETTLGRLRQARAERGSGPGCCAPRPAGICPPRPPAAGRGPGLVLDVDATLVEAHSEKETGRAALQGRVRLPSDPGLAGQHQRGAGRGAAAGERRREHRRRPHRGPRRSRWPRSPTRDRHGTPILVRADGAGCTKAWLAHLRRCARNTALRAWSSPSVSP